MILNVKDDTRQKLAINQKNKNQNHFFVTQNATYTNCTTQSASFETSFSIKTNNYISPSNVEKIARRSMAPRPPNRAHKNAYDDFCNTVT